MGASDFEQYHRRLLGEEYEAFFSFLKKPLIRGCVRVNTLKSDLREVKRIFSENQVGYGKVPWCPDALFTSSNELNLMEHQLGLYYVQDASSLVAPQVLGAADTVLDMCAAPGGKTTYLSQLMGEGGVLVANDDSLPRLKALVYNIQRMGASNVLVTRRDGVLFGRGEHVFDKVLVDAPCSSVGTVTSNREVLKKWSLEWIRGLSMVQSKLLAAAYACLRPGGELVYSTCTTTLAENEHVVENLLNSEKGARLKLAKLDGLKSRPGLTDDTRRCARIYPMDSGVEPVFVAKVVKEK